MSQLTFAQALDDVADDVRSDVPATSSPVSDAYSPPSFEDIPRDADPKTQMIGALKAVGVQGADAFGWMFDCMEIAELAIHEAKGRHPARAHLIDALFRPCAPRTSVFKPNGNPDLFRSHVAELVQRVVKHGEDADLAPATYAEACFAFSAVALVAPLQREFFTAATVCFLRALGEEQARAVFGDKFTGRAIEDERVNQVADVVGEVRKKLADPARNDLWAECLEGAAP